MSGVTLFRITSGVILYFLIQCEFWQIYREITLSSYIFHLTNFQGDQRLIAMSSINCLDSSFSSLKQCIKDEFIDQIVNYIRLAWKLACMLRTYRTCNPTVGFSKYEFNNKLLDDVIFFRITSSVIWSQPYIS